MILECPSCHARYVVAIGEFTTGGRQVRCMRCKQEWYATLPTAMDALPPLDALPTQQVEAGSIPVVSSVKTSPQTPIADLNVSSQMPSLANLPGGMRNLAWAKYMGRFVALVVTLILILAWPIMDRDVIIKAFPGLRDFYEYLGLHVEHSGAGLMFDHVKSELKYDGGTMKLYVEGVVHNTTSETQFIPDIKARALGPDRRIIQSWWVEAPAATVAAGGDVPFHTEIASPMRRTIEDVYLEFYSRDEIGNVNQ